MSRVVRVVTANVVGVVVLLLLLEAAVRILRPDIEPAGIDATLFDGPTTADSTGQTARLRPGAEGLSHGALIEVDADGFVRYAGNASAADTASVWAFLGDSVTLGIGVEPDQTFAGRFASGQDTTRVLNPSVVGWDTADYRRVLDDLLARLDVGRVTLVWCLNDATPGRPTRPGEVRVARDAQRRATMWLNHRSRLYRLAKNAAFDRPRQYYDHDRRFYQDDATLDAALAPVRAMRDTLAARGIPFEVVIVPYEPQLRPNGDRAPQEVLLDRLGALGVRTLDLLPAFTEAADGDPAALYLWSDGIHLSAEGHTLVAREVAAWR